MTSPELYRALSPRTMADASNSTFNIPPAPATSTPKLLCEPWELIETTLPQGAVRPVSESLFTIGNGHISVRGYAEEADMATPYSRNANNRHNNFSLCSNNSSSSGLIGGGGNNNNNNNNNTNSINNISSSTSKGGRRRTWPKGERTTLAVEAQAPQEGLRGTYVNGTYEERLLTRHHRAFTVGTCARECFLIRVPDAFCIDVFVGSEHVSAATGTIVSHSRVLDLRTGELRRRLVWHSNNQGREVTIESSRLVSASRRSIAILKYSVTAKNVLNTDIRIVSRTIVPPDAHQHLKIENVVVRHSLHDASTAVCVRTRNSCKRLVVATTEVCTSSQVMEHKTNIVGGIGGASFTGVSSASNIGGGSPSSNIQAEPSPTSTRPSNTISMGTVTGTGGITTTTPTTALPPQQQQQQQQQKPVTFLAPNCAETENGAETIYTSVISDTTKLELTKYIAFLGDADAAPEDICDLAIQQARATAMETYDTIFHEQRTTMARFWEISDVRVKTANSNIQGALRFNILQLYMSAGRACLHGSPPRGLMSELHGGLHQWDVDAIIIPFFCHIHPETARALLQFRIDTLPQARNLAADMDLPRGALYPLRTVNGGENSPASFCAAFLHVNAVIAYAMKRYIIATNDNSILLRGGADVIFSTALIWLIWGTWDKGQFHIRSVGGPDDYSGLSDNNLFTNLMAQFHMKWVIELSSFFQENYPNEWESLKERCQFSESDITMMKEAIEKIVIFFDAKNRVHPVDQFFMRKRKWDFGELKTKRGLLIRIFDPSVIYRHKVCRTPDVLLASLLLPEKSTLDEARANYKFYEPITTNDSSLSPMIFSVIASQLEMPDKAMSYFNRALFIDIDNVIGNTGCGLHISAAAGSWWCLVVGFGGMRVVHDVLHFNPILPDDWEEYEFFARHHGCLIKVLVTRRTVTYTVIEGLDDDSELVIIHSDTNRLRLEKGVPASVRLFRDVRVFAFDCVIFDMDSLIEDIEDYHYEAWKKTLESFLQEMGQTSFVLTGELYLAYLKHGKPFLSLLTFLTKQGIPNFPQGTPEDTMEHKTLYGLFHRKLHHFRNCVRSRGLRPRDGSLEFIAELRQSGIAVGCVTLSKNGSWLLQEAPQLAGLMDWCLDGREGEALGLRWRPEMDYFTASCRQLNVPTTRTIIVMDGIDGFSKSALEQFKLVVDVQKDPEKVTLAIPRLMISNLKELTLSVLDEETTREALGSTTSPPYHRRSRQLSRTVSLTDLRIGVDNNSLCT